MTNAPTPSSAVVESRVAEAWNHLPNDPGALEGMLVEAAELLARWKGAGATTRYTAKRLYEIVTGSGSETEGERERLADDLEREATSEEFCEAYRENAVRLMRRAAKLLRSTPGATVDDEGPLGEEVGPWSEDDAGVPLIESMIRELVQSTVRVGGARATNDAVRQIMKWIREATVSPGATEPERERLAKLFHEAWALGHNNQLRMGGDRPAAAFEDMAGTDYFDELAGRAIEALRTTPAQPSEEPR